MYYILYFPLKAENEAAGMNFRKHRTLQIESIFRFMTPKPALKRSIFAYGPGFPSANALSPMPFCEFCIHQKKLKQSGKI